MFRHQKRIALAIVIIIVAALAISLVGTGSGPSSQGLTKLDSRGLRG
ncbi:MAG: hypothetical protein ACKO29_06195 [Actinomycetota bacterium]